MIMLIIKICGKSEIKHHTSFTSATRNGFDDDEEAKAAFVANVFCQTEGNETALCGNQAS